ncbi:hypothetical protein K0M31_017699, partial [Melipona bicolor]
VIAHRASPVTVVTKTKREIQRRGISRTIKPRLQSTPLVNAGASIGKRAKTDDEETRLCNELKR